jgi:hypothetical protein
VVSLMTQACIGYPRGARACSMRAGTGSSTLCAFGLPGVRAAATDVPGGVELSFSAVGDMVELRKRVHDVVEGNTDPGPWHLPPEGERIARKTHLSLIDEPGGVVVLARAIDPADLDEIRAAVHDRFDRTRSTACD